MINLFGKEGEQSVSRIEGTPSRKFYGERHGRIDRMVAIVLAIGKNRSDELLGHRSFPGQLVADQRVSHVFI